ncbi:hypothetical protein CB1_000132005 [Camelus ferus]|nr:hypothetical protein CB1_000132005 [Camelus ferus]
MLSELSAPPWPQPHSHQQCVAFQQFSTLKDTAMDFTLDDWEQLGLDQGDLFWDTALDNYQSLFLLDPLRPNLVSHPEAGEALESLVKGSPESTAPVLSMQLSWCLLSVPSISFQTQQGLAFRPLGDMAEAKTSLPLDILEEGLSQETVEMFSKDGLWNSPLGEACIDQSWWPKTPRLLQASLLAKDWEDTMSVINTRILKYLATVSWASHLTPTDHPTKAAQLMFVTIGVGGFLLLAIEGILMY